MCKADMTPIVLVPPGKSDAPVPVPEFRTKHMCRDYEKLRDWARSERNANGDKEESLKIAENIRKKTGTKY
jgi:Mycotoxin biosynthesis protein UstYa